MADTVPLSDSSLLVIGNDYTMRFNAAWGTFAFPTDAELLGELRTDSPALSSVQISSPLTTGTLAIEFKFVNDAIYDDFTEQQAAANGESSDRLDVGWDTVGNLGTAIQNNLNTSFARVSFTYLQTIGGRVPESDVVKDLSKDLPKSLLTVAYVVIAILILLVVLDTVQTVRETA